MNIKAHEDEQVGCFLMMMSPVKICHCFFPVHQRLGPIKTKRGWGKEQLILPSNAIILYYNLTKKLFLLLPCAPVIVEEIR